MIVLGDTEAFVYDVTDPGTSSRVKTYSNYGGNLSLPPSLSVSHLISPLVSISLYPGLSLSGPLLTLSLTLYLTLSVTLPLTLSLTLSPSLSLSHPRVLYPSAPEHCFHRRRFGGREHH